MLYPLRLILGESEPGCAGMVVERFFRLAASQRMARVADIMMMTATAIAIAPAVEPAREKPLIGSVDVGGFGAGTRKGMQEALTYSTALIIPTTMATRPNHKCEWVMKVRCPYFLYP